MGTKIELDSRLIEEAMEVTGLSGPEAVEKALRDFIREQGKIREVSLADRLRALRERAMHVTPGRSVAEIDAQIRDLRHDG